MQTLGIELTVSRLCKFVVVVVNVICVLELCMCVKVVKSVTDYN